MHPQRYSVETGVETSLLDVTLTLNAEQHDIEKL